MRNYRYLTAPPAERLHKLDERFADAISQLHDRLLDLLRCEPFRFPSKPTDLPDKTVYLFSEEDTALYVGRTRNFKRRLGDHCRNSSKANQSPFAFQLAREAAGVTKPSYSGPTTRDRQMEDPNLGTLFDAAKLRLNKMDIRFVKETDPVKQALLEIYCAIALATPYNDFDTH